MDNQATPTLLGLNGAVQKLRRLRLAGEESGEYTEKWLQDLLFSSPDLLPIKDVDPAYDSLIPVCRELSTEAGFIDLLYVTPSGTLTICEVKLWRNPEARRKVVGQILDYASELSRWTYEDLQREVGRATKKHGNVLFEMVKARHPDADERAFCDALSRNLRTGRFLLLIVGDGIREGTRQIADYLTEKGNLAFSLGLVELKLYALEDGTRLVVPSIHARTEILSRTLFVVGSPGIGAPEETDEVEETFEARDERLQVRRENSLSFWTNVLKDLKLDDPSQPPAKPGRGSNIAFGGFTENLASVKAWYSPDANNQVGVYLRIPDSAYSDQLAALLADSMDQIRLEIGDDVDLKKSSADDDHYIGVRRSFGDVIGKDREAAVIFLRTTINKFINTFRHRIRRFAEDAAKAN